MYQVCFNIKDTFFYRTLLSFSKKKRKRNGSENSDLDDNIVQTPPPSPPEEEGIEKRRSGKIKKLNHYLETVCEQGRIIFDISKNVFFFRIVFFSTKQYI